MAFRYYVYRIDKDGYTLNESSGSRVASHQRDVYNRCRMSSGIQGVKHWAGTLVIHSPVPPKEIEDGMNWDCWIYDLTGRCLPRGDGPEVRVPME
jgi:hypothetical protein